MTTTTDLHGYGHYDSHSTPEDAVRSYLGEAEGDYDVDGLLDAEQIAGGDGWEEVAG